MPSSNVFTRTEIQTWKYALIGGLASIPLTVGFYWQSGMENEMSLNMVFFGGLLAGYLATGQLTDGKSVGFRTGVVGGLPVLWIWFDLLRAATGPIGPVGFRMGAVMMAIAFAIFSLFLSGIIGLLGAKVGRWIAVKTGQQRMYITGN